MDDVSVSDNITMRFFGDSSIYPEFIMVVPYSPPRAEMMVEAPEKGGSIGAVHLNYDLDRRIAVFHGGIVNYIAFNENVRCDDGSVVFASRIKDFEMRDKLDAEKQVDGYLTMLWKSEPLSVVELVGQGNFLDLLNPSLQRYEQEYKKHQESLPQCLRTIAIMDGIEEIARGFPQLKTWRYYFGPLAEEVQRYAVTPRRDFYIFEMP